MTTKLSGLLKQVNAAAKEIAAAIQGVDGQIAELQGERQRIGDAPVSKADFLAAVARTLDAKAGSFGANKARHFAALDFSFFAVERGFNGVNFLLEHAASQSPMAWTCPPTPCRRNSGVNVSGQSMTKSPSCARSATKWPNNYNGPGWFRRVFFRAKGLA